MRNLVRVGLFHVSIAVFPAFHMVNNVMLQAGHGTQFALVVWGDRFTGAAVLPHILKADHTVCDALQDFVERGNSMDRRSLGKHFGFFFGFGGPLCGGGWFPEF